MHHNNCKQCFNEIFEISNGRQSLPALWSASTDIAVTQLDSNSITGKPPKLWADCGKSTGNSVQLSAVNTSLHGTIPQEWVQQLNLMKCGEKWLET